MSAGRDAERLPWSRAEHPVPAPHPAVWIRIGGRWRRGAVQHWEMIGGRWTAWLQHDDPDGRPWATWGSYVYAEDVIRPRYDDDEPPVDD